MKNKFSLQIVIAGKTQVSRNYGNSSFSNSREFRSVFCETKNYHKFTKYISQQNVFEAWKKISLHIFIADKTQVSRNYGNSKLCEKTFIVSRISVFYKTVREAWRKNVLLMNLKKEQNLLSFAQNLLETVKRKSFTCKATSFAEKDILRNSPFFAKYETRFV